MIVDLLIIATCVCIFQLTGFIQNLKSKIARWLSVDDWKISLKPFDCSLCLTFWCCILYILFKSEFSLLNLLLVFTVSYLAPVLEDLLLGIREFLLRLSKHIN